jgi:hypothetical protein
MVDLNRLGILRYYLLDYIVYERLVNDGTYYLNGTVDPNRLGRPGYYLQDSTVCERRVNQVHHSPRDFSTKNHPESYSTTS